MIEVQICNKKSEIKYPKLMKTGNIIVLFMSEKSGTVVSDNSSAFPFGRFDCDWNMQEFEDFDGSLVLTNKKGE